MPLAAALLAGVLTRFGLDAFSAARSQFPLVFAMLVAYLVGRRLWPRYTVVGVLAVGIAMAAGSGQIHWAGVEWGLTTVTAGPEIRLRRYDFLTVREDEFHAHGQPVGPPIRAAL